MRFATLCKWWLPPPPTSSLLRFSEDSWVRPEYVHVFSFLSFHPRESCSCWTCRPSLNAVEARNFFCGSSSWCHLLDLHKIDRTEEATLLVTPLTLVMLRASCCLEHKLWCGYRTRNDYSIRTDSIFVSIVVNITWEMISVRKQSEHSLLRARRQKLKSTSTMPLLLRKLPHLRKKKNKYKKWKKQRSHSDKCLKSKSSTTTNSVSRRMVVRNIARSTWRSVLLDAANEGRIRGRYPQYVIIRV